MVDINSLPEWNTSSIPEIIKTIAMAPFTNLIGEQIFYLIVIFAVFIMLYLQSDNSSSVAIVGLFLAGLEGVNLWILPEWMWMWITVIIALVGVFAYTKLLSKPMANY
jgi:hypothetical protein